MQVLGRVLAFVPADAEMEGCWVCRAVYTRVSRFMPSAMSKVK